MKKILAAMLAIAVSVGVVKAQQAPVYNSIATAYVTTTITQTVVFDSTMQAGGTFDYSVLAHNGGGRAGQSDTANIKIQFYSSSNTLLYTANTSYSSNLPNPNASNGNPVADPAVPWTTLSLTVNNCGSSCSNVAYAKVSMYGVDGSFWAGDYGPWYRIPTLTLNGGNNLLYNPEFGPYNGVTAQGWTTSPAFGACQGAWGGSNACIVNDAGVPGQSTAGLVANANGGGPDASGGTLSGTAGGYNSTITTVSISSPSPSPAPAPQGPVTVTNTAGTTASNPSGTTTVTVTNAGTYTNNGTTGDVANTGTFTNNGTSGAVNNSGDFTNNTGATTGAVTNSGTFSNSGTTGAVTNNAGGLFTNSGTTGAVTNNNIFTNNGTTGVVTNTQNFTNNGTVSSVAGNTGLFTNTATVTGGVVNNGTFDNSGSVGGYFNNAGNLNNTGTLSTVGNSGSLNNNAGGTIDTLTYNNSTVNNHGTVNSIVHNGGYVNNYAGGIIGSITNTEAHGWFNNEGTVTGDVDTNSTFTNSGAVQGTYTNGGNLTSSGSLSTVINNSNVNNTATGTITSITNNGNLDNYGTVGGWINNGTINNSGTMGNGTNNAGVTFGNRGTVGDVNNLGAFNNYYDGTVGAVTLNTGSTFVNDGNAASVDNTAGLTFTNAGTITGGLTNAGDVTNNGTIGSVTNTGTFTNSGTVGSLTNSGTFYYGGTVNNYTQTGTGITVIGGNQGITINGTANLGGTLQINNAPTTFGRYTYLTANSINGTYDSLIANPGDTLAYTGTTVQLVVPPDTAGTQLAINGTANNLASVTGLLSGAVSGGSDCTGFGESGGCISLGTSRLASAGGNLNNNGITIAKRINDNFRAGVYVSSGSDITVQNINTKTGNVTGGFVGWNKNADGIGLGLTLSHANNTGTMNITRPSVNNTESANGTTSTSGSSTQIKATYGIPVSDATFVTPYAGVRKTTVKIDGYTETGATYPLSVNEVQQVTTDFLAGVGVSHKINDKVTVSGSIGVVKNLSNNTGSLSGSSQIPGLTTFNSIIPGEKYTSVASGASLTYKIDENKAIVVSTGWQQRGLTNNNITSAAVNLVISF